MRFQHLKTRVLLLTFSSFDTITTEQNRPFQKRPALNQKQPKTIYSERFFSIAINAQGD